MEYCQFVPTLPCIFNLIYVHMRVFDHANLFHLDLSVNKYATQCANLVEIMSDISFYIDGWLKMKDCHISEINTVVFSQHKMLKQDCTNFNTTKIGLNNSDATTFDV